MPLNPFLYPQSQHRRKLQPPSYSSYSRYKPFLKQEFTSQCVYCRLPDGLKGEDSFGVDHYRPQSKFPELVASYTNLFYACNCCNRRKSNFWPTEVQWRARQFIPNPCDHVMFTHLRYRSARVEARSPAGELAARVLMLNDEQSVRYREDVLGVIATLEEKARRVQDTIRRITQRLVSHPEQAEQLTEAKVAAEDDLAKLQRLLIRVAGADDGVYHLPIVKCETPAAAYQSCWGDIYRMMFHLSSMVMDLPGRPAPTEHICSSA